MLGDESTQTKTLCAFCGETARAARAHTITVRTHRPRPGGAGAAATARASLAVKRPTRWCDLRCPAHPVPPGRGARRAPPPTARGRSPAHAGAPPLPPSGETEEASEPSVRRLSSTGQLRRNLLSAGGEDRSSSAGRAHDAQQTECEARRVERARRGRRAGAGGATVPSATSVRAGGSLSPSVSHTVVAWRCLEDRTLHRSTASSVRTNACEGRPHRGPSLAPRRVLALTRARAGDKKITTHN